MTTRQHSKRSPTTMNSNGDEHEHSQEFDRIVDSIDRQLASLRIENEKAEEQDPADIFKYRPSDVVANMHHAPRGVGHTNHLASFLEETSSSNNAYVGGLKLFVGFFIITPFVIWFVVLLALKLKHEYFNRTRGNANGKSGIFKFQLPTPKTMISDDPKTSIVDPSAKTPSPKASKDETTTSIPINSWIAGGAVIDMIELSKAGVSRKERKRLVLRSWRIQSTFISASILIPVLSVVLLERGWKPLEAAIQEIQELNGDVETLAYRGWNAVDGLESSKEKLFTENELVKSIFEYSHPSSEEPDIKALENESHRSRDYIGDSINHDDPHRRAQFFRPGWATSSPTLPDTSDFDSSIFFQWSEMATSLPTEQDDTGNANNDGIFPPWHDDIPQEQESSAEKIDNTNNGSSSGNVLKSSQEGLITEGTLTDGYSNSTSSIFPQATSTSEYGIFLEDWCPDAVRFIGTEELNYWTDSINTLTAKTQAIHQIFSSLEGALPSVESSLGDSATVQASSTFRFVTETTNYVDETIEWFFANDWLLKLLVMVLNVLNGLLLANVYFLSKNNVIHKPTRLYFTYLLVPAFVGAAFCVVAINVASGLAVLVNSDFCSGGSGTGSPQGTFQDVILTLQQQQQNNGEVPNEALNLLYDAVDYYWTGCLTENPLEFLEIFADEIDDAAARVNQFSELLPMDDSAPVSVASQSGSTGTDTSSASPSKTTLNLLNKACQRDMSFLPPAVQDLKIQVNQIRTNIHKLSDTMSCSQISPLFRRISHGAVCLESPQGLAVLWGTSFAIGLLCFVLLTVRAALYNSVKYKKRRPTKPRRVVDKEFEEYKEFMGKYFGEETTSEWKIDGIPLPPTKLQFEFDEDLELKGTFDTAKSTKESDGASQSDNGSEDAGIFVRKLEVDNSSYGSSYDSECSDDSKSITSESGDEQSSAIGSFLSETKSIAMHTISSLRNVKSLLSGSKKNNGLPSHVGNSDLHLGNFVLDGSDEEEITDYDNEVFFSHRLDGVSDIEVSDNGGGSVTIDFGDDKSVANSISDDSLYLPTPTSQFSKTIAPMPAAMFEKKNILTVSKDGGFRDDDEMDDEDDEVLASHSLAMAKHSWTPTNTIPALSPTAPRKPLSFLSRTLYAAKERDTKNGFGVDCFADEELSSLVKPKQLAKLTPFRSKKFHDTNRPGKNTRGSRSTQTTKRLYEA